MTGAVAPAIGGALAGAPGGMVSRAFAGAKAATEHLGTPFLKYEAAKFALNKMGVPPFIAEPIAWAVSGIKKGAKAPGAATTAVPEAEAAAAAASPLASSPGAPAPPAAPAVRPSGPIPPGAPVSAPQPVAAAPAASGWSLQRIRNEVGLAERRAGLTLTESQREAADGLVAQGAAPKEAVSSIAAQAPAAPAPMPTAAAPAVPKARLTAAEVQAYQRMTRAGKTPREAYEAIDLQRQFAQQFGTPAPETVRQKVADRNATGRWRKDE